MWLSCPPSRHTRVRRALNSHNLRGNPSALLPGRLSEAREPRRRDRRPSCPGNSRAPGREAREWAAELFVAVSVAYRELTDDPHALSDEEITGLAGVGYDPPFGIHVTGDECSPARVRFEASFDVLGLSLSTGRLRAAIETALDESLQTDHRCDSEGRLITGTVTG